MAPELTMAVILIEFASVISAVRCLTSWYGVTAETIAILSNDKSELQVGAKFNNLSSAGATSAFGRASFLTRRESGSG